MIVSELLKRNRKFLPIYDANLSNHLSMALIALERLGADFDELQKYFQWYVQAKQLVPIQSTIDYQISSENWTSYLGERSALNAYFKFFSNEVARLGSHAFLNTYLPALLPSIGAQAFHCLIRLGYAVDAEDPLEMAFSLAYWASVYWPIEIITSRNAVSVDPESYLQKVNQLMGKGELSGPGNIEDKMKLAVKQTGVIEGMAHYRLQEGVTLASIAELLLQLYLQTNNFTVLHAVTSCHALRLILPFIEKPTTVVRHYWQAICVAYMTVGAPKLVESECLDLPMTWEAIQQKAITFQDEHVIKLVYTSWCESNCYNNPLYQQAALLRMGCL